MHRLSLAILAGLALALAWGCESTSEPAQPSMQDRQDAAMKDPFNYGPTLPGPNGKGAPQPENKQRDDSAKGEWNRFWNP